MQQATDLARQMVTRWGMSPKLGPVTLAPRDDPFLGGRGGLGFGDSKPYSEATAQEIDEEVQRILQECYDHGLQLLRDHRRQLDRLAQALLEKETLDEQEILSVTGLPPAPRNPPCRCPCQLPPLRLPLAFVVGRVSCEGASSTDWSALRAGKPRRFVGRAAGVRGRVGDESLWKSGRARDSGL